MTTIVSAGSAAQFLSLVPRMLGYRPSASVVLIPFAGSRSIGAMRFDLPGGNDELDRTAATLIGMVCRLPDADAVAAVVYTDARFDDGGMPHRELLGALGRRADACGVRVTDALCVAADAWGSHLDPACPRSGRPLGELADAPGGAEHLPVATGDQASGADLPRCEPVERDRTARALVALEAAVGLVCGPDAAGPAAGASATDLAPDDEATGGVRVDPQALAAVCLLDDLPTLFEDALSWNPDELPAYEAAVLIWCLARPALRDIALAQWSSGMGAGDEALDAQLRWESGEEYPTHLAMRMWGEGERPDPDRLEAALALSRRAAAAAPRALRPGALATSAWLAWALGRSTHADRYATFACEIEPEHGLSEIVRSFVSAGHLPDWAFRRQ